jgi:mono/diheme cytochrome c family protein
MKKTILAALILGLIMIASSCYYDKEGLLYSATVSGPCTDSTGVVSYSQKVVPLLQQQCYSCHTGGSPSGGIAMGTYTTDKAIGQNGKLYGSINYSAGYSPMPKGAAKMSNCQVATIKKWVDAGMPNN